MKTSFLPVFALLMMFVIGCVPEEVPVVTGGASNVVSFEKDGSTVTSISIYNNTSINDVKLVIAGNPSDAGNIQFSIVSDNQSLLPDENIVLSGEGKFRSLTITPVAGLVGEATLTGTVIDTSINESFTGTLLLKVLWDGVALRPLNDTGQVYCSDYAWTDNFASRNDNPGDEYDVVGSKSYDNNLDCSTLPSVPTQTIDGFDFQSDVVRAGQDAIYGRDVTDNDSSNGFAGFNFTKIDASGNLLDASAANWSCVKDGVTGLMWETKTPIGLQGKNNTYTWYNSTGINDGGVPGVGDLGVGVTTNLVAPVVVVAGSDNCDDTSRCDSEKYAADINSMGGNGLCNYNDWRLPTREELSSIISRDRITPAIDSEYFPNTVSDEYWSSSIDGSNSIFVVDFDNGLSIFRRTDSPKNIRLVRGNKTFHHIDVSYCEGSFARYVNPVKPVGIYIDHNDGTVTDIETGLMWQKCSLNQSGDDCSVGYADGYTWQAALKAANDNTDFGYSDWRLPNVNELSSLMEDSCTIPAINTLIFPRTSTATSGYWSSTPSTRDSSPVYGVAWTVNFRQGAIDDEYKVGTNAVRLVRDAL